MLAELRQNLQEELTTSQREAVLRPQLSAIQDELGEGAGKEPDVERYRQRVATLEQEGTAAPAMLEALQREVDKLARIPAQSPERGWSAAWLDAALALPGVSGLHPPSI